MWGGGGRERGGGGRGIANHHGSVGWCTVTLSWTADFSDLVRHFGQQLRGTRDDKIYKTLQQAKQI